MNKYLVQCSVDGEWVPFTIFDDCIYNALDWVHENVQRIGVCISLDTPLTDFAPHEHPFGMFSQQWYEQRLHRAAVEQAT